jgi:periplasmic protein TonB
MNKDLIIGILVSISLHGFILGSHKIISSRVVTAEETKEEIKQIEFTPPPPPEEEEEDEVKEIEDDVEQAPMMPPSLVDVPTIVLHPATHPAPAA